MAKVCEQNKNFKMIIVTMTNDIKINMLIIKEKVGISAEELNEKNQIKIFKKYNYLIF